MLTINLFDEIFRHTETSANTPPVNLKWIRDQMIWPGTTVFTDDYVAHPIVDQVKCRNKILWVVESKEITADAHQLVEKFRHRFDTVLLYDRSILELHPEKFRFAICASQRELQQDKIPTLVYPKTKMVSTIVSQKRQTIGHRFRHQIVESLRQYMDVYGRTYNPIPSVSFGLKDYRFSVTVENSFYDYYFSEKILNCFYMGTIPIYWGCPSIGNFFDLDGVITFNHLGELHDILRGLTPQEYEKRLPAVHKNFELAQKYISAEEWLFHNVRDILFE